MKTPFFGKKSEKNRVIFLHVLFCISANFRVFTDSKSLTSGGVTGKNHGQRIPNETDHLLTPHSIYCSSCLILKQRAYLENHGGNFSDTLIRSIARRA